MIQRTLQAVTRVNVEQASKRATREPTWLSNREGRRCWWMRANATTSSHRRGSDDGMHVNGSWTQHGKPNAMRRLNRKPARDRPGRMG